MIYGALETGGTKCRAAVFKNDNIIDELIIPTKTPAETFLKIVDFFRSNNVTILGIGSFGPIALNQKETDYGQIKHTTKIAWKGFNVYKYFIDSGFKQVYIDTDVGAAALGEYYAHQGKVWNLLYITIGTGVGVGVIRNKRIFRGLFHPEMGHMIVNRHQEDNCPSVCVFHDNCLEGLGSGKSLEKRYNLSHKELSNKEEVWDLEGYYIAQALYSYTLAFAPEKIIIGGGVSKQRLLLPAIKKHFIAINNNYYQYPALFDLSSYITLPKAGEDSGILGAYLLAKGEG